MDLMAADSYEIPPRRSMAIPTGIAIALPIGYEAQVRSRSGMALRYQVSVGNAPGTVDTDYRGEIMVILINQGTDKYVIKKGERIAQLVVMPVPRVSWVEVDTLPTTERGSGGFGSSGA
jgi:dUTP pyrophosphatase